MGVVDQRGLAHGVWRRLVLDLSFAVGHSGRRLSGGAAGEAAPLDIARDSLLVGDVSLDCPTGRTGQRRVEVEPAIHIAFAIDHTALRPVFRFDGDRQTQEIDVPVSVPGVGSVGDKNCPVPAVAVGAGHGVRQFINSAYNHRVGMCHGKRYRADESRNRDDQRDAADQRPSQMFLSALH